MVGYLIFVLSTVKTAQWKERSEGIQKGNHWRDTDGTGSTNRKSDLLIGLPYVWKSHKFFMCCSNARKFEPSLKQERKKGSQDDPWAGAVWAPPPVGPKQEFRKRRKSWLSCDLLWSPPVQLDAGTARDLGSHLRALGLACILRVASLRTGSASGRDRKGIATGKGSWGVGK